MKDKVDGSNKQIGDLESEKNKLSVDLIAKSMSLVTMNKSLKAENIQKQQ